MSEVFHLGLTKAMLEGAKLAITPGAPERVERIAKLLDKPKFLASTREFTSWLGYIGDKAVVVCSTGIGGPSVSIAVEELAQLGVRTFLRIGTTGAIQPHINVGDILVTTGAVRLDGASLHFAPPEYPAVAYAIVRKYIYISSCATCYGCCIIVCNESVDRNLLLRCLLITEGIAYSKGYLELTYRAKVSRFCSCVVIGNGSCTTTYSSCCCSCPSIHSRIGSGC